MYIKLLKHVSQLFEGKACVQGMCLHILRANAWGHMNNVSVHNFEWLVSGYKKVIQ